MPVIRPEAAGDLGVIEEVTAAAFLNALHTSHTEHLIVNALRRAGVLTVSLVAEEGGDIIGHVAVSPVAIFDGAQDWYGLGPVSVLPSHQRRGVGSALIGEALDALRSKHASGCVLLGDPHYYRRFGFRAEPGLVLPGVPPEYFQALAFAGRMPQGIVSYHEAFGA